MPRSMQRVTTSARFFWNSGLPRSTPSQPSPFGQPPTTMSTRFQCPPRHTAETIRFGLAAAAVLHVGVVVEDLAGVGLLRIAGADDRRRGQSRGHARRRNGSIANEFPTRETFDRHREDSYHKPRDFTSANDTIPQSGERCRVGGQPEPRAKTQRNSWIRFKIALARRLRNWVTDLRFSGFASVPTPSPSAPAHGPTPPSTQAEPGSRVWTCCHLWKQSPAILLVPVARFPLVCVDFQRPQVERLIAVAAGDRGDDEFVLDNAHRFCRIRRRGKSTTPKGDTCPRGVRRSGTNRRP